MATNTKVSARPLACDVFSSEMLTVKVGPEAKAFWIHKALAMHYSGYFQGALRSDNFEEGKTGIVTLKDVETYTFEAFADWLYTQKLPVLRQWHISYPSSLGDNREKIIILLYIFADRFLVPALKDPVKSLLIDCSDDCLWPNYETIIIAFGNLPSDSPVLRMLVDVHCRSWQIEFEKDEPEPFEKLPSKFLHRVMAKYASKRVKGPVRPKLSDYEEPEEESRIDNGEPA